MDFRHNTYFQKSKKLLVTAMVVTIGSISIVHAQRPNWGQQPQELDPVVQQIIDEVNSNSQLEDLAFELLDVVGPRLVGTPQMNHANDWTVEKFNSWGITAEKQQFGEWHGWERGISHIDMVHPRVKSLAGTQLAWSPTTNGEAIEAEVIHLPTFADEADFDRWLAEDVKGKFVMISMPQPTGRPDHNWKEYAKPESFEKMKTERDSLMRLWQENISSIGLTANSLPDAIEQAGAAGILTSYWSREFGSNKIFGARTKIVPTLDVSLEDYGMLWRLAERGHAPRIKVETSSKSLGVVPSFNTIAEIKGSEFPDEYVILSAHLDSWEGGSGATDNGSGTITMMEVARILKKLIPNPKRTILVGLWGSEEQGLNGSRAFVLDNPEIVEKTQVVLNQDNGTGRVADISGSGFVHAYDFMGRWLSAAPREITQEIKTDFPGSPGGGGSDHASFIAAGVPAFMLSSLSWGYGTITWHTNLDTYDKLVFDDLKSNVILIATLAYKASEEPELVNREQRVMPVGRNGEQTPWPAMRQPRRTGVGY